MSDEAAENKASVKTPPYIAFNTLLTFCEELKSNGVPPQIDSSVLKRFSGSVRTQLLSGIKYLGLMTDDKKPTPALEKLADAYGDETAFKGALKAVLAKSYSFLSGIDLKTATPTMFADEFRKHSGGQEAVLSKSRTFYLNAAKYAGIELGTRLTTGSSAPRATGAPKTAGTRKRAARRQPEETPAGNGAIKHNSDHRQQPGMMEKLLEKFPTFDPKWDAATQAKWFDGFSKLMANAEEAKKENGS